ncbi:hypothetical protein FP2506_02974 [Fulvimarina pelagi HTCC2506]|uniref:DUF6456 domain-containing protein n=2 Tax=Fulvimarina pelagi TaxID=217511 RepID=Q0G0D8_9HYPH|nr:DUF6456 domain-containing protein [Fulvimarina pelagi]EAU40655.1 hypothetical protein FP2506_02974 [Fulvimarina pelagi HTCC2506]BAT31199.1 hypothetical protein [Fulvimarina pelagi]
MNFQAEKDWAVTRLSVERGRQPAFLSEAERDAAERLRADYTRGSLMPSVAQSWNFQPRERSVPGGARDLSDNAIDARNRIEKAVAAIGPELSDLVLDVACHLKGLELVERERGWPARSAKMLLKAGLGILARHYGFTGAPVRRASAMRTWRQADARPKIANR